MKPNASILQGIALASILSVSSSWAVTTVLIDYDDGIPDNGIHDASIRNGGFEDSTVAAGTTIPDIPFWNSFFPESDVGAVLSDADPATGTNRGTISGFSGTGVRYHLTQTIPAAAWTIQAGDVFTFSAKVRAGTNFTVGTDSVQLVLHVVDSDGVPVPTAVANADRIVQPTIPAANITATSYFEFTVVSDPVPEDSPWIGNLLKARILVNGARNDFALVDDVFLSATAIPEPGAISLLGLSMIGLVRRKR